MPKRTTIEIDDKLLARAKRALGKRTTRATVEEALRRAVEAVEGAHVERVETQLRYLEQLEMRVDSRVLASDEMWR